MSRHNIQQAGTGGGAGTSHVSAAGAAFILFAFGATIWTYMRSPSTAIKLFITAGVGTALMLMLHVESVLNSTWACWGVLIGGWWLGDHLRKEEAARKERASTQKGVRQ